MELDEFFEMVAEAMRNIEIIPLENGDSYDYLGPTTTKINRQEFRAFLYEISPNNQKRVTVDFIYSMYQQTLRIGNMPTRREMLVLFPFELCSRPCNYTVASFIVSQLIANN